MTDDRRRTTEDRRQTTEDGRQTTEDRGQGTEGRVFSLRGWWRRAAAEGGVLSF